MNRPRRLPNSASSLMLGALLIGLPTCGGDDTVYVRVTISEIPQMTARIVVRPFVGTVSYGEERFNLTNTDPLVIGFKLPPDTRGAFRVDVESQDQSGQVRKTCDFPHAASSTVEIVEPRSTSVDVKLSVTIPDSGINQDLYAVWSHAPDDVWVAGAGGVIGHWDGCYWRSVPSQTQTTLRGLHGVSSPQKMLWAVGGDTTVTIVRSTNGGSFQNESPTIPGKLYDLWGATPTNLWAVGGDSSSNGLILKNPTGAANNWTQHSDATLTNTAGTTTHFASIDGRDASHIYAVGSATNMSCTATSCVGALAFYNGSVWERPTIQDNGVQHLAHVYAEPQDRIWFGALMGRLLEWDGTFASTITVSKYVPLGTFMSTHGLIGFYRADDDRELYFTAVNDGMPGVLHRNVQGSTLQVPTTGDPIDAPTLSLGGSSPTDIWIVGKGGVRYHFNGTAIKKYAAPL